MESYDETVQRLEREKAARDAEEQRLQTATAIEEATTVTFRGLNQLILRGYRPELGEQNFCDAIWLRHPSGKAKFPTLILYPGRYIVGSPREPDKQEICILLDEAREFDGFLRTVPLPSLWDRIKVPVQLALFWTAFVAFALWFGDTIIGIFDWR